MVHYTSLLQVFRTPTASPKNPHRAELLSLPANFRRDVMRWMTSLRTDDLPPLFSHRSRRYLPAASALSLCDVVSQAPFPSSLCLYCTCRIRPATSPPSSPTRHSLFAVNIYGTVSLISACSFLNPSLSLALPSPSFPRQKHHSLTHSWTQTSPTNISFFSFAQQQLRPRATHRSQIATRATPVLSHDLL